MLHIMGYCIQQTIYVSDIHGLVMAYTKQMLMKILRSLSYEEISLFSIKIKQCMYVHMDNFTLNIVLESINEELCKHHQMLKHAIIVLGHYIETRSFIRGKQVSTNVVTSYDMQNLSKNCLLKVSKNIFLKHVL